MASRFPWGEGFAKDGRWTGKVEPNYKALAILEKRARSTRKLKPIVWAVWNDFFHPAIDNKPFRNTALGLMAQCNSDVFLILTKRPETILISPQFAEKLPNVWLGVTVESQGHVDRIQTLIATWPGRKFVSIEPCLGAVDIRSYLPPRAGDMIGEYDPAKEIEQKQEFMQRTLNAIRWVILGGESGPHARPMHYDWARSVRDQCVEAGVPFFFKQNGEWATSFTRRENMPFHLQHDNSRRHAFPEKDYDDAQLVAYRVGKKKAGRLLDGRTHDEMPEVK